MGEANGNATEAARIAGYKGDTHQLQVMGSENLLKPVISAALAKRQEDDPLVAGREVRQRFWTRVMAGEEGDESRNPMGNRLRASELLAKTGGDFGPKGGKDDPNEMTVRVIRCDIVNAPQS